jgi:hypothetical protein
MTILNHYSNSQVSNSNIVKDSNSTTVKVSNPFKQMGQGSNPLLFNLRFKFVLYHDECRLRNLASPWVEMTMVQQLCTMAVWHHINIQPFFLMQTLLNKLVTMCREWILVIFIDLFNFVAMYTCTQHHFGRVPIWRRYDALGRHLAGHRRRLDIWLLNTRCIYSCHSRGSPFRGRRKHIMSCL